MKKANLSQLSVAELVSQFAGVALDQTHAELNGDVAKMNRHFLNLREIERELQSRRGDQRAALSALYDHADANVRLKAAKATLAISYKNARAVLEALAHSKNFPWTGDAGMTLWSIDKGIFKPK